jgi:hypothetical protein
MKHWIAIKLLHELANDPGCSSKFGLILTSRGLPTNLPYNIDDDELKIAKYRSGIVAFLREWADGIEKKLSEDEEK